ncbi:MAG TPA: hypothetical protein VFI08_02180 [Spirochaetia bacterium]|nr:hypothetical protein [Spirochaetia bacterium]
MKVRWSRGAVLLSLGVALAGCASLPRAGLEARQFPITVDYGQALGDLIRSGNYQWVYSEVNPGNFPPSGTGSRAETAWLVRLNPVVPIDSLVAGQKALGRHPADLRELLTFGRMYPDVQRSASIVGFGSWRVYPTITYVNFGPAPMAQWTVRAFENFYPTLIHNLLGRSVVLIQEDQIPDYDTPGFFACFLQDAPGPGGG